MTFLKKYKSQILEALIFGSVTFVGGFLLYHTVLAISASAILAVFITLIIFVAVGICYWVVTQTAVAKLGEPPTKERQSNEAISQQ